MTAIRLLGETENTVTLSRADWNTLLEEADNAADLAAVRSRNAHEAAVGVDQARRDYLTGEEAARLLDGESPVRIWREKRDMTQRALAIEAGVSQSYLSEVEARRKPGSAEALLRLAGVLRIGMENLVADGH